MAEAELSTIDIPLVLPNEILKKILEKLDSISLVYAQRTCTLWKEIIHEFQLMEQASGKFIVLLES